MMVSKQRILCAECDKLSSHFDKFENMLFYSSTWDKLHFVKSDITWTTFFIVTITAVSYFEVTTTTTS